MSAIEEVPSTRRKSTPAHRFPLPVALPVAPTETTPFALAAAFADYRLAVEAARSALRIGRLDDALSALDEAALPRLKPEKATA